MKLSLLLTIWLQSAFAFNCINGFRQHQAILDYDDINTQSELSANTNYNPSGAVFYTNSNYLHFYFSNLQGNMGRNLRGSCGIVALGMLLSYYDSFLNDSIIPETYDVNNVEIATIPFNSRSESPGTLCEVISDNFNYMDDTLYNNFVYSQRNISLHCKLLLMNNYVRGTSYSTRFNLLNNFLSNISNLSNYAIDGINKEAYFDGSYPLLIRQYESDSVKQYVLQNVQNNIPVLVSVTNANNTSHHAIIVYGYDSDSSSFIANMGWGYGNSRTYLSSNSFYSLFKTAMVVNFNLNHSHSNNYVFRCPSNNNSDNFYVCHCGYSTHTQHHYTCFYTAVSSVKHRGRCCCGAYSSTQELHFFDNDGICIKCGYDRNYYLNVEGEEC